MQNFQDTGGQITKIISSDNDNVKCWVTWSDRDSDETQVETSGDHGHSVTQCHPSQPGHSGAPPGYHWDTD